MSKMMMGILVTGILLALTLAIASVTENMSRPDYGKRLVALDTRITALEEANHQLAEKLEVNCLFATKASADAKAFARMLDEHFALDLKQDQNILRFFKATSNQLDVQQSQINQLAEGGR